MNTLARKIIMQSKDSARSRRDYNSYDSRRDYNYDRRDSRRDYNYDSRQDRDYNRKGGDMYDRGYDQGYDRGYDQARRDYARGRDRDSGDVSLSHEDMKEWKRSLENEDGTRGEHFSIGQIEDAMNTMGLSPRGYTVEDLCMTANMLYSDYCKTLKTKISRDEEAMYYTSLAKDFLEDKDASVSGSEKLAAYYYCIVNDD